MVREFNNCANGETPANVKPETSVYTSVASVFTPVFSSPIGPNLAHMKAFAYLHFSIPTILSETSCHFLDFLTNFQYIP